MTIYKESWKKRNHMNKIVNHIVYWFDVGHKDLIGMGSDIVGEITEFQAYPRELKFNYDLKYPDRHIDFSFEKTTLDEVKKDVNLKDVFSGLFEVGLE